MYFPECVFHGVSRRDANGSCEEYQTEGKVMNRTVGKLVGDGLWAFVTPTGVVCAVRLDFVLLLLFCKKVVPLNASRASPTSGKVQGFWWEKQNRFLPRTKDRSCGILAIICDFWPLLASCMRTEQKQSNPRAYSAGDRGAVTLPYCSSGDINGQVVAVGTSAYSSSVYCDQPY